MRADRSGAIAPRACPARRLVTNPPEPARACLAKIDSIGRNYRVFYSIAWAHCMAPVYGGIDCRGVRVPAEFSGTGKAGGGT